MKLIPYLSFTGNCEEALNSYKDIFNGKIESLERYDNPAMNAPEEFKTKVLHAHFVAGEFEIYASDTMRKPEQNRIVSNVSLSLTIKDVEEAKKLFQKLSESGKVNVPFEKQFWVHGMVIWLTVLGLHGW